MPNRIALALATFLEESAFNPSLRFPRIGLVLGGLAVADAMEAVGMGDAPDDTGTTGAGVSAA